MLDENLPTFLNKPAPDNPNLYILYFTQNGSTPSPEYILKRPDPSLPASKNKYAVGLVDTISQSVAYGEVLIEPEWTVPSLSATELRRGSGDGPGGGSGGGVQSGGPPVPILPDSFNIQLYNPDQSVQVRQVQGSWGSKDSWEFDMPEQSFKLPSTSEVDRARQEQQSQSRSRSASGSGGVSGNKVANPRTKIVTRDTVVLDDGDELNLAPRISFKWKRDGRLSHDMACYMTGKTLPGGKRSKEPDITVALFKERAKRGGGGGGTETSITIYEPNMQRVEVEDRKGLDIVLLLGAEAIRDLYLSPRGDIFNIGGRKTRSRSRSKSRTGSMGAGTAAIPASKIEKGRKGSREGRTVAQAIPPSSSDGPSSSSAAATAAAVAGGTLSTSPTALNPRTQTQPLDPRTQWEIESETQALRLQEEKEAKVRERRDRAEQKRIRKMLEEEDRERAKKDADVANETERLKKLYGVDGQEWGAAAAASGAEGSGGGRSGSVGRGGGGNGGGGRSGSGSLSSAAGSRPPDLPPRRPAAPQGHLVPQVGLGAGGWMGGALPVRPVSAMGNVSYQQQPSQPQQQPPRFSPPPQQAQQQQQQQQPGRHTHSGGASGWFGAALSKLEGAAAQAQNCSVGSAVGSAVSSAVGTANEGRHRMKKKRSVHF